MRVLVDVGVGKAVEAWLRAQGHDVLALRDVDPGIPDEEALDRALREGRLVVTMDKDFGNLVYRLGRGHAGVLLLRLEEARSAGKVTVLQTIFEDHAAHLPGAFSVYQRGKLRIRQGPAWP